MPQPSTIYLLISGAVTAHRALELHAALQPHFERVITAQTPRSMQIISPLTLARLPGSIVVSSYLDQALQPRAPVAPVVFAPCSFNALNKLALGMADNLPLTLAAEMIGLRQRVVVAVSMREGLWQHPVVPQAIATLRGWGVRVVEPRDLGKGLMLAPTDDIMAAILARE